MLILGWGDFTQAQMLNISPFTVGETNTMTRSLLDSSKWSSWYQMKAPIFFINPVKSYGQHVLTLKVTSENVAKVR